MGNMILGTQSQGKPFSAGDGLPVGDQYDWFGIPRSGGFNPMDYGGRKIIPAGTVFAPFMNRRFLEILFYNIYSIIFTLPAFSAICQYALRWCQ
jgi:hypothetical protein